MWLVGTSAISENLPFRLESGTYIVGRSPKAHIVIDAPSVSRRHARLVCQGDSLAVQDLGSRHGTFVNDAPADTSPVQIGAKLRFGSVVCLLAPVAMRPVESSLESSMDAELTPAQQQVLNFVLKGLDEPSIAKRLERSGHTIHTHVKALFKHFEVHSRGELLAKLLSGKTGRLP